MNARQLKHSKTVKCLECRSKWSSQMLYMYIFYYFIFLLNAVIIRLPAILASFSFELDISRISFPDSLIHGTCHGNPWKIRKIKPLLVIIAITEQWWYISRIFHGFKDFFGYYHISFTDSLIHGACHGTIIVNLTDFSQIHGHQRTFLW